MDHLPLPPTLPDDFKQFRVPFLLPDKIKHKKVTEIRCKNAVREWQKAVQRIRKKAKESSRRPKLKVILPELQWWLYFGLLSQCIKDDIDIADFKGDDDDCLDSSVLPELLDEEHTKAIRENGDFDEVLGDVYVELNDFIRDLKNEQFSHQKEERKEAYLIVLAIRVLTDSLRRANLTGGDDRLKTTSRHSPFWVNKFAVVELDFPPLRKRMSADNGWCLCKVASLFHTCTASTLCYLSALKRPKPDRKINHRSCTETQCNLTYPWHSYRQTHTSDCCARPSEDCPKIHAPDKIKELLREGDIPLLTSPLTDKQLRGIPVSQTRPPIPTLQSSGIKYKVPFIAFSHVWSGGLGNPHGNAINACQLRDLWTMTKLGRFPNYYRFAFHRKRRVIGTIEDVVTHPTRLLPGWFPEYFWIDTLSIPRDDLDRVSDDESESQSDLETGTTVNEPGSMTDPERALAIDRMTQTYLAAEAVVVLDPELREIKDTDDVSWDEFILYIFSMVLVSSWTTRCWTYQEAAMAKELLVKFADFTFPLHRARQDIMHQQKKLQRKSKYRDIHDMIDDTSAWLSRLPGTGSTETIPIGQTDMNTQEYRPELFTRIWNELALRSTSRRTDRFLILAMLLGIKPSDVHNQHPRARLKSIFSVKRKLPVALMFQAPLSKTEREQLDADFKEEEETEQRRGRKLPKYDESPDSLYPLPRAIRNVHLLSNMGWMGRGQGENYLHFDTELLAAGGPGSQKPALFRVPHGIFDSLETPQLLQDRISKVRFSLSLRTMTDFEVAAALSVPDVYLLTSCTLSESDGSLPEGEFSGVLLIKHETKAFKTTRNKARPAKESLLYVCHVSCSGVQDRGHVQERGHPSISASCINVDRQEFVEGREYRIICNFDGIKEPGINVMKNFTPMEGMLLRTWYIRVLWIVAYHTAIFAMDIAGLVYVDVIVLATLWVRMSFEVVRSGVSSLEKLNHLKFDSWVNGINPRDHKNDVPLSQRSMTRHSSRANRKLCANLRMPWFALICTVSIIYGALSPHPNVRTNPDQLVWQDFVAFGLVGYGEIFVNWSYTVLGEFLPPVPLVWVFRYFTGPHYEELRDTIHPPSGLTMVARSYIKNLISRWSNNPDPASESRSRNIEEGPTTRFRDQSLEDWADNSVQPQPEEVELEHATDQRDETEDRNRRTAWERGQKFGNAVADVVQRRVLPMIIYPWELVIRGGDILGKWKAEQEQLRHDRAMQQGRLNGDDVALSSTGVGRIRLP